MWTPHTSRENIQNLSSSMKAGVRVHRYLFAALLTGFYSCSKAHKECEDLRRSICVSCSWHKDDNELTDSPYTAANSDSSNPTPSRNRAWTALNNFRASATRATCACFFLRSRSK